MSVITSDSVKARFGPSIRTVPSPSAPPPARDESESRLFARFLSRPTRRLQYTEAQLARSRGGTDDDAYRLHSAVLKGEVTEGAGVAFARMLPDLVSSARGSYGAVFVYRATPRVREALRGLRAATEAFGNFVHGERDVRGSKLVAVKVQHLAFLDGDDGTLAEKVRENVIHAYLSQSECRTAPDDARWCARDVVPELYWAGQLENLNMMVTVMEGVEGTPLGKVPPTPELARALEAATHTLWAFGVVHNDLHKSNVLVDHGGRLKIIDFGRAIYAPRLAGASPSPSGGGLVRVGSGRSGRLFRSASGRYAPTASELRSTSLRRRVQQTGNADAYERGFVRYHSDVRQLETYAR